MRLMFLAVMALVLVACSEPKNNESAEVVVAEKETKTTFDQEKYDLLDLSTFGLEAKIHVPSKKVTNVDPSVVYNEESGIIEVSSGKKFKLRIKETEVDKGLMLDDLANDLLFQNTVTEEEDNFVKYTSSLPDGSNKYNHFCAWINIGDVNYMIENVKEEEFSDHYLNRMINCVKSIEVNNSI